MTGLITLLTGRSFSEESDVLITALPTSLAGIVASATSASLTLLIATTALSIVISLSMEARTLSTASSLTNTKTGGARMVKIGVREAFGTIMTVFLALNVF